MTTAKKKLLIFRGTGTAVNAAIGKFLLEDPRWNVTIPERATGNYMFPSVANELHQKDTLDTLTEAQVIAALNANLTVAVFAKDEDDFFRWVEIGVDLDSDIEAYTAQEDGTRVLVDYKVPARFEDPYIPNPNLPKAVWLDVDGTAFTMFDKDGVALRGPFEYDKVHLDTPLQHTIDIVKVLQADGWKIVVMSGREESCKEATLKAFADVGVYPDDIFMRPVRSYIPDNVLKYELFKKHVEHKYDIRFAFDDRDKVVKMLRTVLHIPVYQVNYGAF